MANGWNNVYDEVQSILGSPAFGSSLAMTMGFGTARSIRDWGRMSGAAYRAMGEANAKLRERQGAIDLKEMGRSQQRYLANIETGFGGVGVQQTGTAMDVLNSAITQAYEQRHRAESMVELLAAQDRYQGEYRAWQAETEAAMSASQASQGALAGAIETLFA